MTANTYMHWFLPVAPIAVVWLVGAILAGATWKRHPTVSLLALLACLLLLFTTVAGSATQYWVISQQMAGGWSTMQVSRAFSLLSLCRVGLSVAGYILLLCAVFNGRAWRGERYAPPPVDTALHPPREPAAESEDIQKRHPWG
jgi:hypothetical protein